MTPAAEILLSLMERGGAGSAASLPVLLCEDAVGRLPVVGVGITLVDADGVVARVAASDAIAAGLEDLQLSLGEGPAAEAVRTGRLMTVPDLAAAMPDRWPAYTPACLAAGVRAVMAYPLRIGGIQLGALSLYRSHPGPLEGADLALALQYADAAVLVLLHLQALAGPGEEGASTDGLPPADTALESAFLGQPEVHQATGMVSSQAGVDLKDALLLRRPPSLVRHRRLSGRSRADPAMARERLLATTFAELSDTLDDEFTELDLLQRLVDHCTELFDASAAGVVPTDSGSKFSGAVTACHTGPCPAGRRFADWLPSDCHTCCAPMSPWRLRRGATCPTSSSCAAPVRSASSSSRRSSSSPRLSTSP